MANNEKVREQDNENVEATKPDYSLLSKSPVVFNMVGLEPVSARYILLIEGDKNLKDFMLKYIRKTYFKDVRDITFMAEQSDGSIKAYVWLPENSSHLVDPDTVGAKNLIVNKPITCYSKDLNDFIKRYCFEGNHRLFPSEDHSFVGIKVDVTRFVELFFDAGGFKHQEANKTEKPQRCFLELEPKFADPTNSKEKYGKPLYIIVDKALPRKDNRTREIRPLYKA